MPPQVQYDTFVTNTEVLLYQFLEHVKREYAANTARNKRYQLLPFFKFYNVENVQDITLFDLDIAIAQHTASWRQSSISTLKQALRDFFRYCHEYKEINLRFNYAVIKRRKYKPDQVETFSKEEITRVVNACKTEQDRLMIAVLFETGMRISELLNLRVEDINLCQIRVFGKGSNHRVVHMSTGLSSALREYRVRKRIASGCVFRPLQKHYNHPTDRYISAYTVRHRIVREFKKTLGVKMHPHQLRHSFAVAWLRAGGDIRTLQIILGHENIETTQWYLHLTDKQNSETYYRVFGDSVLTS